METLAASADFVILDMHGGGFTAGNALMYLRTLVQWLADIENGYGLRGLILSVEYELAPNAKWPRQVNECMAAYEHIRSLLPPERIILAGDSAGGCLVLNLLAKGCECAAAVTISPWTRLRSDASTIHTLKDKDWISASGLKVCEDAYVPEGVDAHSSEISPFYQTSFKNYPPLLVTYGTGELFIEDIQAFVNKARKDQATVDVLVRENMAHKWSMQPLYCPSLQAWKSDNAAIAQWMVSHLRAKE
ncbi:Alpha/Beta hydrolase protein [Umbelopsis sp. AD052]|nr:Alpha/Beta hydrolase protein [Umbelopsis sp. AD052]